MLSQEQITAPSSSQPKNTYKRRKPTKVTEIPQFSEPTNLVADEVIHEEMGDNVEKAATSATSLDAEQDSGNINRTQSTTMPNDPLPQGVGSGGRSRHQETIGDIPAQTRFKSLSKQSYDSPLGGVNTPQSDKDIIELKELMDLCTKLSDIVLNLETTKTTQVKEIDNLKKRSRSWKRGFDVNIDEAFEKREVQVPTADMEVTTASAPVTTVGVSISTAGEDITTAEPSTPPITTNILEEEDLTIAQTLMKIKTMMDADYELAARLHVQEQGELIIEERSKLFVELMDKRKKHFAKLRAKEQRRKPITKARKRN
ncbi:hypothetical protein Tco_0820599 [Tanacetum coccineum]|uniref:Uncharacterized protein n=1 Tax=Tanacetum coccineum TaxID=301880 RepID=A0ABQ5A9W7_9ASTR